MRVLIAEDDLAMRNGLHEILEAEGYDVVAAPDGAAAVDRYAEAHPDFVVLDIMMPRLSGYDVCREIRKRDRDVPIVFLSAKNEEIDKVLGLELGADDYITKPFGLRELLARTKAVLRRTEGAAGGPADKMALGSVEVDFKSYTAVRTGKNIDMTPKEFEILKFLWQHRNQTVSRDQLLTNVWGYDDTLSTRTIDNFILKLRQKIEDNPAKPKHIITLHGLGYKLVV